MTWSCRQPFEGRRRRRSLRPSPLGCVSIRVRETHRKSDRIDQASHARDDMGMGRPCAECPEPQRIQWDVQGDQAVLRDVYRHGPIERRGGQRRERVKEEGSTALRRLPLPGVEVVPVEPEPHSHTLDLVPGEVLLQRPQDTGLGLRRLRVPVVTHEERTLAPCANRSIALIRLSKPPDRRLTSVKTVDRQTFRLDCERGWSGPTARGRTRANDHRSEILRSASTRCLSSFQTFGADTGT